MIARREARLISRRDIFFFFFLDNELQCFGSKDKNIHDVDHDLFSCIGFEIEETHERS